MSLKKTRKETGKEKVGKGRKGEEGEGEKKKRLVK